MLHFVDAHSVRCSRRAARLNSLMLSTLPEEIGLRAVVTSGLFKTFAAVRVRRRLLYDPAASRPLNLQQ